MDVRLDLNIDIKLHVDMIIQNSPLLTQCEKTIESNDIAHFGMCELGYASSKKVPKIIDSA